MSKVKLALGAASLFLFIVGVKRSFHLDEGGVEAAVRDARAEARERLRRQKRAAAKRERQERD